jgi:hypothetical protein
VCDQRTWRHVHLQSIYIAAASGRLFFFSTAGHVSDVPHLRITFRFSLHISEKTVLFGRGKTPVTSKNSFHSKSHLEIHIFTARVKINIVMLVHIARIVFNWLVPYIFGGWNMKFNMSLLPLAQTHMRFTIFTLLVNFHITMANHNFEWVNPL